MVRLAMAFALLALFFLLCFALLRWNEVRYLSTKGLPPGTMGAPLFGETTEFLKQGPDFMKNQRARYGSLFKSHILGCPVVCMDPEMNRFILMNEGKGFVPGYPQSMLDILGESNIVAVCGPLHKSMRSAMLGLINPPTIRDQLLPKIDRFMSSHLSGWAGRVVDIQDKTKEMAMLSSLKQIAGIETGSLSESLKSEIFKLVLGTLSLPINLPGTNYRRGFQARKKVVKMLRGVIEARRASSCRQDDMLVFLLKGGGGDDDEGGARSKLADEQIIDLIIALIYSGYETFSTTTMMAVKFLHDQPKVLQELRKEHLEIRRTKTEEQGIDWNDYKSMRFTRAVIYETLRLATVVNGVLRKTTHNMEMKGFIIPKGWKIYVYTRELNHDEHLYPEPSTFNPWRWMEKNGNLDSHQHFLIFGGGSRLCPGKELGILEIAAFLHYFVMRYRWEEIGGDAIVKFPRVEAPNGFRISVSDLL